MIVVNDTDVVVISLHAFFDLGIDKLWIEYGSGKHQRWLPIHTYAQVLVEEVCYALAFWYALTSCDSVLSFAGRRKRAVWDIGNLFSRDYIVLC